MTPVVILVAAAVVAGLRLWRRRQHRSPGPRSRGPRSPGQLSPGQLSHRAPRFGARLGDTGLVAMREIHERVRSGVFRVGTVVVLLAVAAVIVIPSLRSGRQTTENVGLVGSLPAPLQQLVVATGVRLGSSVRFVPEGTAAAADDDLRAGRVNFVIVDGRQIVVNKAIEGSDTSTSAVLVRALSDQLGVQQAYQAAGLSAAQTASLAHARPLPVISLHPAANGTVRTTSQVGAVLLLVMLTQYNTWILMGVMQEKSSRVVEVLLAAVRPIQLLTGKVLGIGLVAMGQAALVAVTALGLAEVVGSNLVHGAAPLELGSALLWLVLGYAFYCWVYAAAGSTAERQDQAQSLVFPLSLPIFLGYITSLTVAASGHPTLFFKVLAYLPPTAPFAMPILVGLARVTWWQFTASVLISLLSTVVVARLAAEVYRRAILRTGRRVPLRDLISRRTS